MLRTLGVLLLILLLVALVAAYLLATHVLPYGILQPQRRAVAATPDDHGLAYGAFELPVNDSIKLHCYYIPTTAPASSPKANLILLHGIGSCKEAYLGLAPRLTEMGYNLLLVDLRAHGKSQGEFTTFGAHEKYDVQKMLDWLDRQTDGLPTGVYGNSMGAAIALQAMEIDRRLRFGFIESTFTDLPTITEAYGARLSGVKLPRWLTDYVLSRAGKIANFDPETVRPVDAAATIDRPILLIHGDADRNINISHGEALFKAFSSPLKEMHVVEGGDHADLWEIGGTAYETKFFGWLEARLADVGRRGREL